MNKIAQHKAALIEALEKSLGIVTTACKSVDISRSTFYLWMREDEEFKKAVDEIENVALDFAESQLHKQMKDGQASSTIFYLKTKGKKRGYVERQEIEQIGNTNTFQVEIIDPQGESYKDE